MTLNNRNGQPYITIGFSAHVVREGTLHVIYSLISENPEHLIEFLKVVDKKFSLSVEKLLHHLFVKAEPYRIGNIIINVVTSQEAQHSMGQR